MLFRSVIPTLEVLGVEVCPLPTALLSTQTDGFERYHFEESTDSLEEVLKHWDYLVLSFDTIYSGFLGSHEQVDLVRHFIMRQRAKHNTLVVIDPVLGDGGKPYAPINELLINEMRTLVMEADLITPNTTEAALLLEKPMQKNFTRKEILFWAKELSDTVGSSVTITSQIHPYGDRGVVAISRVDNSSGYSSTPVSVKKEIECPSQSNIFCAEYSGLVVVA